MRGLKIGQVIYLLSPDNPEQGHLKSYVIEETEDYYYIKSPSVDDELSQVGAIPDVGGDYWVEYICFDGALCRFHSLIEEVRFGAASFWRVRRPNSEEIIREQRREHVRVPADLLVRLEIGTEVGPEIAVRQLDVYTRNISGGGLAVFIPAKIPVRIESIVRAKFTLPNNGFAVEARCLVLRVEAPNDSGFALVSLHFSNLKESIRQKIIQYSFWRQRALV